MQTKTSLVVLAGWEYDLGFRLGGAPVRAISDKKSLNLEIEQAVKNGEPAVLAMPEFMKIWITEKNMKTIGRAMFPLVVYYPYPEEWAPEEEAEETIEKIVQAAIGYRLRIKL
ncbi:MAG: hypothetical protein ACE5EN_04050 [Nitrospinota bacterium]